MRKSLSIISSLALLAAASQASAFNMKQGHFIAEAGGYWGTQGKTQIVNINGLVGDQFQVTKRHDGNGLFGLGYLFSCGGDGEKYGIDYGINAFYLAKATVNGVIDQELTYTNLAYHYQIDHIPVYVAAKAHFKTSSDTMEITVDAGIGPNFMRSHDYQDWSLDGGMTLPDNAFSGNSKVKFSAMAGIGLQFREHFELGYRFFYLGENNLSANSSEIQNSLSTGNVYAHSLLLTWIA